MGQSGGNLSAGTGVSVLTIYPPQGVDVDGSLDDVRYRRQVSASVDLPFGVAAGYADTTVVQSRIITAGNSATYDLYTGTDLLAQNGGTAAFRLVKYLGVFVTAGGDTSGVRIGGAASNELVSFFASAGDQLDIFPDGPPFQAGSPAGVAVTSSVKNLKVENLGAEDVTLTIVVSGNVIVGGMWMGIGLLTYP